METLYRLRDDTKRLQAMSRRSADTDEGLSVEHGVVGSPQWWASVDHDVVKREVVEGIISRVYWGSMADWPMFSLRNRIGEETEWTREGDPTKYAVGARVRVTRVIAAWKAKTARKMGSATTDLVIEIEVEDTGERVSSIAPGPGGKGYQLHVRRRCSTTPILVSTLLSSEHPGDRQRLFDAIVELLEQGGIFADTPPSGALSSDAAVGLLRSGGAAEVRISAVPLA